MTELEKAEIKERRRLLNRTDDYRERQSQIHRRKLNYVCVSCRKAFKIKQDVDPEVCPSCGSDRFYEVGCMARAPRKSASNKKWEMFEKKFVDWPWNKGYKFERQ